MRCLVPALLHRWWSLVTYWLSFYLQSPPCWSLNRLSYDGLYWNWNLRWGNVSKVVDIGWTCALASWPIFHSPTDKRWNVLEQEEWYVRWVIVTNGRLPPIYEPHASRSKLISDLCFLVYESNALMCIQLWNFFQQLFTCLFRWGFWEHSPVGSLLEIEWNEPSISPYGLQPSVATIVRFHNFKGSLCKARNINPLPLRYWWSVPPVYLQVQLLSATLSFSIFWLSTSWNHAA